MDIEREADRIWIINPETQQFILIDGPEANALLARGVITGKERRYSQMGKYQILKDRESNEGNWIRRPDNQEFTRIGGRAYNLLLARGVINGTEHRFTDEEYADIQRNELPRYYLVLRGNREYVGIFVGTRRSLVPYLAQYGITPNEPIDVIDIEDEAKRIV